MLLCRLATFLRLRGHVLPKSLDDALATLLRTLGIAGVHEQAHDVVCGVAVLRRGVAYACEESRHVVEPAAVAEAPIDEEVDLVEEPVSADGW